MKVKIILILGPTAVGKTALGIKLAQKYNGEIISGDSQQVYRELSIGTAKATQEEQAAAKHHLIDVRDVTEAYSAYNFVQEAKEVITELSQAGKLPIIVGGTGLYVQSLIEGYHLGGMVDQDALLNYRSELERLDDEILFDMVDTAGIEVKELNRRRAIRALELHQFADALANSEPDYEVLLIGLTDDRQVLYDRINQRVDQMIAQGLLDEAKWLYDNYPNVQASRGIGYKELFPYFEGKQTLEEVIDKLKQQTRRFAKRQLTWFKNRMSVPFYQISNPDVEGQIEKAVEIFLAD